MIPDECVHLCTLSTFFMSFDKCNHGAAASGQRAFPSPTRTPHAPSTHPHPQLLTASYLSHILELALCKRSMSSVSGFSHPACQWEPLRPLCYHPCTTFYWGVISIPWYKGPCLTYPLTCWQVVACFPTVGNYAMNIAYKFSYLF